MVIGQWADDKAAISGISTRTTIALISIVGSLLEGGCKKRKGLLITAAFESKHKPSAIKQNAKVIFFPGKRPTESACKPLP